MRFDKVIAKIIRVQFFCLTVYFTEFGSALCQGVTRNLAIANRSCTASMTVLLLENDGRWYSKYRV